MPPRIAVLPFLLAALPAQSNERSTELTWHTDLGAARKVAAERKAPLLVVFRCER
ncbi:MAG TPA: hypothetical protein VFT55_12460 [Planctomycetota bacterium]|nr:hypothetical protein [Planctomycetota bacterium]